MSKYTTQVRFICEQLSGVKDNYTQAIQGSVQKIFDFDFPVFDESYRWVLCSKILKNFYTQEIGEETYGLWKLRMDQRLNKIMPYYNELYKTLQWEYDPLYQIDITTEHHGTGSENVVGNETGTTSGSYNKDGANEKDNSLNRTTSENHSNKVTTTEGVTTSYNDRTTNDGTSNGSTTSNSTTKSTGDSSSDTTTTGSSQNHSTTVESKQGDKVVSQSDTPQNGLTGVLNNTYLSFAEHDVTGDSATSETNENGSTNGTSKTTGETSSDTTVEGEGTNNQTVNNVTVSSGSGSNDKNGNKSDTGNKSGTLNDTGKETGSWDEKGTNSENRSSENKKVANTVDDYITHVYGINGSRTYGQIITEYRESLINVDAMVLEELENLFMLVW